MTDQEKVAERTRVAVDVRRHRKQAKVGRNNRNRKFLIMPTNSDKTEVKINKKTTVTLVVVIPIVIIIAAIISKFSYVENKTEINNTNIKHNCEQLKKHDRKFQIQTENIDSRFNRLDDKLDMIYKEIKN